MTPRFPGTVRHHGALVPILLLMTDFIETRDGSPAGAEMPDSLGLVGHSASTGEGCLTQMYVKRYVHSGNSTESRRFCRISSPNLSPRFEGGILR